MEKLTAVQWLALRYHHRQGYLSQDDIAEAKAMEKEQIIKAAGRSCQYMCYNDDRSAEEYYNEKYGK
jgi:hypothetical protein